VLYIIFVANFLLYQTQPRFFEILTVQGAIADASAAMAFGRIYV